MAETPRRYIKPDVAIPCHYASFPLVASSADEFVAELKGTPIRVAVLPAGGSETFD